MGRSLQLLAQVGSPQFAKCVSLPSPFSSSSAPLLWMPTSTRGRKSAKNNVVVSLKDSALLLLLLHTTGHALLLQLSTSPAMPAMTVNTTAHAELTTTAREKLRQRPTSLLWLNPSLWPPLTPSMATMGMAWDTMAMDSDTVLAMVGVTSTDPPVVHHVFSI